MRTFLLVVAILLSSDFANAAESQGTSSNIFHAYQVAGNVFLLNKGTLESPGDGSVAALVGNDGVLLVNATNEEGSVLAALKTITDKPVRYVIHTGCDTAGSAAFARDGATIVAHENVRRRLEAKKCYSGGVLPTLTFDNELTLHLDDEDVRIIALPVGHTDGDVIVYFRRANVAVTGDVFSSTFLPFYSKYAGGNALGVNEQLHKYLALLPDDVKIIPGHGTRASLSDVRRASKALDEIRDAIAEQVAKGKTLDQLQKMNLLAPWEYLTDRSEWLSEILKHYYDCLTGPLDPKFQL
jgi:cyclase